MGKLNFTRIQDGLFLESNKARAGNMPRCRKGSYSMGKKLYTNGPILTMEPGIVTDAVLTENGCILQTGERRELKEMAPEAELVDLEGRTLLPGFVDPHSHIAMYGSTLAVADLHGAEDFDDLAGRLDRYQKQNKPEPGEWIIGFGYDHNFLREHAHPTKEVLDRVAPDRPVAITHVSGHVGVLNSAALRAAGVNAGTPAPEGGFIGRENGEPTGYLEETALRAAAAHMPPLKADALRRGFEKAQEIYLSHGITTAQDGLTQKDGWELLRSVAEEGGLKLDVACYVDLAHCRELVHKNARYCRQYSNRLKIGGYKLLLDGSPQGRTAWMLEPYLGASDGYQGYPTYQKEQVENYLHSVLEENMQILAHCNGDAAARQFIRAYDKALFDTGLPGVRPVMIHAQFVTDHQLDRMAQLEMIASFFPAHTYYWGGVHMENFGMERARRISPAQSALERNVTFTFHQDTPVLPPNMLEALWCAVNRRTKDGLILGEEQRLTPLEALRAITINGAYQYDEEREKGSILPGKRADFVILSDNPLTVDPMALKELAVLQTIKDGKTVYQKK